MGKGARARRARREQGPPRASRPTTIPSEFEEISRQLGKHRWTKAPWTAWPELRTRLHDATTLEVASHVPFGVIEPDTAWVTSLADVALMLGCAIDDAAARLTAWERCGDVLWDRRRNAMRCTRPFGDITTT